MLQTLGWLLKFLVFLALVALAVKNSEPVTLRYLLGLEWRAPLVVLLLVFFTLGAAVGVAATFTHVLRARRELTRVKRDLSALPPSPEPGT
jgi:putative membrane protein